MKQWGCTWCFFLHLPAIVLIGNPRVDMWPHMSCYRNYTCILVDAFPPVFLRQWISVNKDVTEWCKGLSISRVFCKVAMQCPQGSMIQVCKIGYELDALFNIKQPGCVCAHDLPVKPHSHFPRFHLWHCKRGLQLQVLSWTCAFIQENHMEQHSKQ